MGSYVRDGGKMEDPSDDSAAQRVSGSMIIDPPSPFAPLAEWENFLRSMESCNDPDHPDIRAALQDAHEAIAMIKGML